ncbi:MAG: hypothetical protein Q7N50_03065 [Armatimonadota bacterium]|nr:hypothetical protein [Armatimonadota bacterium]
MRVTRQREEYIPTWAWFAIALGLIMVVLIVWFAAASSREAAMQRYEKQQPAATAPSETKPQAMPSPTIPTPEGTMPQEGVTQEKREPVSVYIYERKEAPVRVIVVPEEEKGSVEREGYRAVDLPGEFSLYGLEWRASQGALMTGEALDLMDTGKRIEGHHVFISKDDVEPYDALYLETTEGSGKYIKFEHYR